MEEFYSTSNQTLERRSKLSVLIKNGIIVNAIEEFKADVLIEDEKVVKIGRNLTDEVNEVIDAEGKFILPGGVDQHVHYTADFKGQKVRGFHTSNAAIVGGTTTVVEFINQEQGKGLIETIQKYDENEFADQAMVDYSFHGVVCDPSDQLFEDISKLPEIGVSTLKLFMAYKGLPTHSDDETIFKALKIAKDVGVTVMVHAENGDVIESLQKECIENGNTTPYYHAISRPPIVELEATMRAIQLAKLAEAPIYIVHVTTKDVMEEIRKANNDGFPVSGETCTHYLVLDKESLAKPNFEGAKYVCSPALRTKEDQESLWKAISKGWLNAVSSDHCGYDWKNQKHMGVNDFTNIPNGSPGVQDRLAILWTYGVEEGKITRQKLVDLYSTTPAKNIGLDYKKGHIAIGYDADIVIYNPNKNSTISNVNSYHDVDFNTYEGMKQIGSVEKVLLRGKLMVENGKFIGKKGDGKFIKSKPYGLSYKNK